MQTARLRPLSPFGAEGEATTLDQLHEALRRCGRHPAGAESRVASWVARDLADLRPHVEAKAAEAERAAQVHLEENGRREAEQLAQLIDRQLRRVEAARATWVPPAQGMLDLRSDEERAQDERERRQREADRRSWDTTVARLKRDLEREPVRVREGYRIAARRVEPVGLVYLWPEGGA